jgi:phage shock protein PspC (stress-responsive transcriptional regulator)
MSSQPNNLRINQDERRFLGVCAGIADYLDMPVVLVRIIFVISILTWPTLIIAYFALYFWLDRNLSTEKVSDWLSGSAPTQHLKNLDYRRPLYRNMRTNCVAGVCSGIADYLEIRAVWVRCAAILAAFILGPYALLIYGVCWFVMEPNPAPRHNRRNRRHRRHRQKGKRHGMSSSRINSLGEEDLDAFMEETYTESMAETDDLFNDAAAGSSLGKESRSVAIELDIRRKRKTSSSRRSHNEKAAEECADTYYSLENRLRELEAFITSKKFRLHCEINRI